MPAALIFLGQRIQALGDVLGGAAALAASDRMSGFMAPEMAACSSTKRG